MDRVARNSPQHTATNGVTGNTGARPDAPPDVAVLVRGDDGVVDRGKRGAGDAAGRRHLDTANGLRMLLLLLDLTRDAEDGDVRAVAHELVLGRHQELLPQGKGRAAARGLELELEQLLPRRDLPQPDARVLRRRSQDPRVRADRALQVTAARWISRPRSAAVAASAGERHRADASPASQRRRAPRTSRTAARRPPTTPSAACP